MQAFSYYGILLSKTESKLSSTYTPAEMTTIIRRILSRSDIVFITDRNPIAEINYPIVSGKYDPDLDEDDMPAIEIAINYHPDQKEIRFMDIILDRFVIEIIETIMHELCHQGQYRKRNFRYPKKYKSINSNAALRREEIYLGNKDEIEAYAVGIATEIFLLNSQTVPIDIIAAINEIYSYQKYCSLFGVNHQVVKKLRKFIMRSLREFSTTRQKS